MENLKNSSGQPKNAKKPAKYHFKKVLILSLLTCVAVLISFAQGPDQVLSFSRMVPSSLDPERIDRNISAVTRWPQWFFSTAEVKILDSSNQAVSSEVQTIQDGSLLKIRIDPKKGERKKFELTAKVVNYLPGKKLDLALVEDSTGRLTRLFDHLNWNIELIQTEKGTHIRETTTATTRHWKSRLFGRIAEKILLNQVSYPNILKLAELKQPFSVDSPNQPGGLFSP
jgi:hypothetical protein